MQVLDAAARDQAQVVADIVAGRSVGPIEHVEAAIHRGIHVRLLRAAHLAHVGYMPSRDEEKMPRIVRVEVERHYNMFTFAYY